MKKSELKIEKVGGCGMTTKLIFIVPIKINDTWTYSESRKAYTKSATNQADALKIRDEEVLPVCEDR